MSRRARPQPALDALLELTNTDTRFYPLLGPFLSRREVVAQVGGPIWDEDAKTWLIATLDSSGTGGRGRAVVGFVAAAARGGHIHVESLYTAPEHDDLAAGLLAAVVARFGGRDLHAVVQLARLRVHLDVGFVEIRRTARFATLIRKAGTDGS